MRSLSALAPGGRRLLRFVIFNDGPPSLAFRTGVSLACHNSQGSQQFRQYAHAMPSPTVRRQGRLERQGKSSLIFSDDDVPPVEFWKQGVPVMGPGDLTAETCFNTATQYCALATRVSSTWKGKLQRDHNIDLYTLHYTASLLMSDAPGPSWKLGLHMLGTASDLDYAPSTLTLIRLLSWSKIGSNVQLSKLFRDAERRFSALVQTGKDPDALTLQGLLTLRRKEAVGGDHNKRADAAALSCFDRAIEAAAKSGRTYAPLPDPNTTPQGDIRKDDASAPPGGEMQHTKREPKWTCEAACHLGRGRILSAKRDGHEAAEAAFRIAALELDMPEAYLELGKMILRTAGREKEGNEYLLKAAVSGNQEACLILAEAELQRSDEEGLSKTQKKHHQRLAAEWSDVGGDAGEAVGGN